MAETRRKRAVAVGRAAQAKPGSAEPSSSYALRLEQALEAISAAQAASKPTAGARTARGSAEPTAVARAAAEPTAAAGKASPARRTAAAATSAPAEAATSRRAAGVDSARPRTARPARATAAAVATDTADTPTETTRRSSASAATRARRTSQTATASHDSAPAASAAPASATSRASAARSTRTTTAAKRTTAAARATAALAYQQAVTDTAEAAGHSWAVDALDADEPAHLDHAAGAANAEAENEDDAELEAAVSSDSRFAATFEAAVAAEEPVVRPRGFRAWLNALDRLPPIRLPLGPAIPWKVGLPMLVAAVVLMATLNHSTASADAQGTSLPAQETYAVQQSAPLFADSQKAQAAPTAQPAQPAPVGVQDPTGGFDFFDVGIKLAAVLGLAYGSLVLLKRAGMGGAGSSKSGGNAAGLKVVSSLALAPNRSVHVISVPGGKSLLVAATPNQVNLIADLGEVVATQEQAHDTSFLDVLASKIGK